MIFAYVTFIVMAICYGAAFNEIVIDLIGPYNVLVSLVGLGNFLYRLVNLKSYSFDY